MINGCSLLLISVDLCNTITSDSRSVMTYCSVDSCHYFNSLCVTCQVCKSGSNPGIIIDIGLCARG